MLRSSVIDDDNDDVVLMKWSFYITQIDSKVQSMFPLLCYCLYSFHVCHCTCLELGALLFA